MIKILESSGSKFPEGYDRIETVKMYGTAEEVAVYEKRANIIADKAKDIIQKYFDYVHCTGDYACRDNMVSYLELDSIGYGVLFSNDSEALEACIDGDEDPNALIFGIAPFVSEGNLDDGDLPPVPFAGYDDTLFGYEVEVPDAMTNELKKLVSEYGFDLSSTN